MNRYPEAISSLEVFKEARLRLLVVFALKQFKERKEEDARLSKFKLVQILKEQRAGKKAAELEKKLIAKDYEPVLGVITQETDRRGRLLEEQETLQEEQGLSLTDPNFIDNPIRLETVFYAFLLLLIQAKFEQTQEFQMRSDRDEIEEEFDARKNWLISITAQEIIEFSRLHPERKLARIEALFHEIWPDQRLI